MTVTTSIGGYNFYDSVTRQLSLPRADHRRKMRFVEAVLQAEFDIDKGSICRVQYPKDVGDASLLAELMLPEGAHNHVQDWTVFMLNRSRPEATALTNGATAAAGGRSWSVHAYRYNDEGHDAGWVLIDEAGTSGSSSGDGGGGGGGRNDGSHSVTLVTEAVDDADSGTGLAVVLLIDIGEDATLRVKHHDDLQYSSLQPDFVSMYSLEGDAIGLHFNSAAEQEEFKAALDQAAADAAPAAPMLWCLNHVSNRRDNTVRRGAQVKAITLPYLTLPYLTLPYLTLPYLPYLTLPYLTLPYLT